MASIQCPEGRKLWLHGRHECFVMPEIKKIMYKIHDSKRLGWCKCMCKEVGVPITTAKYSTGKIGFRVLPGREHAEHCVFHRTAERYRDPFDGRFDASIFAEEKEGSSNGKKRKGSDEDVRHCTFVSFCRNLIAMTNAAAFGQVNKNWPYETSNLVQPDMDSFFKSMYAILHNDTSIMKAEKTVFYSIPSRYRISYGFFDHFGAYELVAREVIRTNPLTLHHKQLNIEEKHYEKMHNQFKIFGDWVVGPYLYWAIVESSSNRVVRIYVHPVAIYAYRYSNEEKLLFTVVDSDLERRFAWKFFKEKVVFMKPIVLSSDFYAIAKKFFIEKRPSLIYLPDFILFSSLDDYEIPLKTIVEISGFPNDQKYMAHLHTKITHYEKIKHKYIDFDYLVRDEKRLSLKIM